MTVPTDTATPGFTPSEMARLYQAMREDPRVESTRFDELPGITSAITVLLASVRTRDSANSDVEIHAGGSVYVDGEHAGHAQTLGDVFRMLGMGEPCTYDSPQPDPWASRSLHAQALAATGDHRTEPMADRELAIRLIRFVTGGHGREQCTRRGHLTETGIGGSTVSHHMVVAAGLDPDESTGWTGADGDPCPCCGHEGDAP